MDAGKQRFWTLLVGAALISTNAAADNFRIDTEVFFNGEERPISENITLFADGVFYDFTMVEPKEITIFDAQRGQFDVLDVARRVRLTLSTDQVLRMNGILRDAAIQEQEPFFFAPKFEEEFDEKSGWLDLKHKRMSYRVKGTTAEAELAADRYRTFADWYARLNATRPGSMPPFPRLELNRALSSRGLIPERVELTIAAKNRIVGKDTKVMSRHSVMWRLSSTDQSRIEKAKHYRKSFDEVSFATYRRLDAQASKGSGDKR